MEPDTVAREATPADASAALNFDCSSEFADCLTGGVYGDGSCADITPCVQACDSAGQDADCQRDCYSQASQEAVQHDLEVQLCTRLHCDTEPELTGCATAAVAEGGPCHALFLTCATADPDRSGD